jgi:hypothetical protein
MRSILVISPGRFGDSRSAQVLVASVWEPSSRQSKRTEALEQGLEESMAGSDPVSVTQPTMPIAEKPENNVEPRDHRASPSIRGRTSTDAARGGTSCSIVRRRFQALRGHGSIAARASGICTLICRRSRFATVFEQWQMRRRSSDGSCMRRKGELSAAAIDRGWRTRSCFRRVLRARGLQ